MNRSVVKRPGDGYGERTTLTEMGNLVGYIGLVEQRNPIFESLGIGYYRGEVVEGGVDYLFEVEGVERGTLFFTVVDFDGITISELFPTIGLTFFDELDDVDGFVEDLVIVLNGLY